MRGGDAMHNLAILRRVHEGEIGPYRDSVVLNAGAMIYVGGKADSIADGVTIAQTALDTGAARALFEAWVHSSNDNR
jgi:anthranilate phosphoribosyltransferase